MKLEELRINAAVMGLQQGAAAVIIAIAWSGPDTVAITFRTADGALMENIVSRADESRLQPAQRQFWSFDGDGARFRLVAEAQRIRLAHLFDPVLAVHTSRVDPLPHQITAVYEAMLPRQSLRFLLADDPGAGKTIMAGLLIKELMAREVLKRCLIVCPGNLAEQWQDELHRRFQLPFEILTNEKLNSARSGNWFLENPLGIARLDKLARDAATREKLLLPDCRYDLIVCDEAHKLSASYSGGDIKYTQRYKLGEILSGIARHLLLMTATPHNGKEEDFQLFLRLLDADRFEGRFREGAPPADISDIMRRMVKENLLKFDGCRLFPERFAYTAAYALSPDEQQLYAEVTEYVRAEFNRAETLENGSRKGSVGFALTILQRRLASSPEAIYQSLLRRRQRLEKRFAELEQARRFYIEPGDGLSLEAEELEDFDETPESEQEWRETEILDQATAARTLDELRREIVALKGLEEKAEGVRRGGQDAKWRELARVLEYIFALAPAGSQASPGPHLSSAQPRKLVVFTEHRDTLSYLERQITTLMGRGFSVAAIHGGLGRDERHRQKERFLNDAAVHVLLATDAAGEGVNLQRAHLMVNYDLPWNPNRLEQRFGRIHRIGQHEVCHLWNLVAQDTREGAVYIRLLEKLEEARRALGGQVFDVLGKLQFAGQPLRELLIKAVRYGDQPEVRAQLERQVEDGVDRPHLQALLEEQALARDTMDLRRVARVREEMERAEARRLQPFYVESFFLSAFSDLGGVIHQREARRYEITHVPAALRGAASRFGWRDPVLERYQRIAFEKELLTPREQIAAEFICPGHPLLETVLAMILERDKGLLQRGTVLADDGDPGLEPRVLFIMGHDVREGSGERRLVSRRMLYIEMERSGGRRHLEYAPYLDYRPLAAFEPGAADILRRPECAWIGPELAEQAMNYVIGDAAHKHYNEVWSRRWEWTEKTRLAVRQRLKLEIAHWDRRAEELRGDEREGKPAARMNWMEARRQADELHERMGRRMEALNNETDLWSKPPLALGGVVIVPAGLLRVMAGEEPTAPGYAINTLESAARARDIVMAAERKMGFEPRDRELEKLGYDIESRVPGVGKLRFIEVKGRVSGAGVITVTRNEILFSLNKPEDFILAIVEFFPDGTHRLHYVWRPFKREPEFGVTSVNYDMAELLARGRVIG